MYTKMANKWWDGYAGQENVIMEDLDSKTHKCLIHHLKIWADRYGYIGESKQGAIADDYLVFAVTSQESIEEFCGGDLLAQEALLRRYR